MSTLAAIGDVTEVELASRHPDGSLSPFTTMWAVTIDDNVYVRSAGGPNRPWYRHAINRGAGRIRSRAGEADVTFEPGATPETNAAIDAAYHAKYDRYGPGPVGSVTGPDAHPLTIRLVGSTS